MIQGLGNEPRDSFKGTHKRLLIRVNLSFLLSTSRLVSSQTVGAWQTCPGGLQSAGLGKPSSPRATPGIGTRRASPKRNPCSSWPGGESCLEALRHAQEPAIHSHGFFSHCSWSIQPFIFVHMLCNSPFVRTPPQIDVNFPCGFPPKKTEHRTRWRLEGARNVSQVHPWRPSGLRPGDIRGVEVCAGEGREARVVPEPALGHQGPVVPKEALRPGEVVLNEGKSGHGSKARTASEHPNQH